VHRDGSNMSAASTTFSMETNVSNVPSMAVSNFSASTTNTAAPFYGVMATMPAGGQRAGSSSSAAGGGAGNNNGTRLNAAALQNLTSQFDQHKYQQHGSQGSSVAANMGSQASLHLHSLQQTPLTVHHHGNRAASPPVMRPAGSGGDGSPTNANQQRQHNHQQQQRHSPRGASPRDRSHQRVQRDGASPARHHQSHQHHQPPSIADLITVEIARVLAITTLPESEQLSMPSETALRHTARAIADAILAAHGPDAARQRFADLCESLEQEDREGIRSRIRSGALTPVAVAHMELDDLLSAAERSDVAAREEEDTRNRDLPELTRTMASINKDEDCPHCHHTEAEVVEAGGSGGDPRFWSGQEEQQTMTLLRCLACHHEWSREAKY
jgi:hypothetical protein